MLLGKRPRPSILRRTTSMSGGMAVDTQVSNMEAHDEEVVSEPLHLHDGINDPHHAVAMGPLDGSVAHQARNNFGSGAKEYEYDDERLVGMVMSIPPTAITTSIHHRQSQTSNSAHVIHTADFLRSCGLCNRRLAPGRDIYMYRGDTAFCSLECREQQMKQDERKGKWKVASDKEGHRASPPTVTSKASTKSETIAAA